MAARCGAVVGLGALAIAVLAACSSPSVCGPGNCIGCCDANGTCVGGSTVSACGVNGAQCQSCSAGFTCLAHVCSLKSGTGGGGAGPGGGAGGGGGGMGLGGGGQGGSSGMGGGGLGVPDGGFCDTMETAATLLRAALKNCPAVGDENLYAFSRAGCDQAFACSSTDEEQLLTLANCEKLIVPCSSPQDRPTLLSQLSLCTGVLGTVNPDCVTQIQTPP